MPSEFIKRVDMKRIILSFGLMLAISVCHAQGADDYIVKTKGLVKTSATSKVQAVSKSALDLNEPRDFVGKNFKYYSLCDWKDGMKFMVIPEKYDLIVKTFYDATTNKGVSSVSLRHKIMAYKGHTVSPEGHTRINFLCQDDGKMYYYEIPSGSFDDYCYGKSGVPMLAYLGDVDIAREVLKGKKLFTRAEVYRIDTDSNSDGYLEVSVPLNEEVTVKEIGVGTRNFPVKIIVEDEDGNEFYQNVALSKTNSGMREEEFAYMGNSKNAFYGSFSIADEVMRVSDSFYDYIGKIVHTRHTTEMFTKGDGRDRIVKVPKMMTFSIDAVVAIPNTQYVNLSLTELESRRMYSKTALFDNFDENTDTTKQKKEEFFGYIFDMGEGSAKKTTQQARAAIRAGRVTAGMTEVEVLLAMGEEPDRKDDKPSEDGRYRWYYNRSSGILTVVFGHNRLVENYITPDENKKLEAKKNKSARGAKTKNK